MAEQCFFPIIQSDKPCSNGGVEEILTASIGTRITPNLVVTMKVPADKIYFDTMPTQLNEFSIASLNTAGGTMVTSTP